MTALAELDSTADLEGFTAWLATLEFAPMRPNILEMVKIKALAFGLAVDIEFVNGTLSVVARSKSEVVHTHMHLLRENRESEYHRALTVLQREYGKQFGTFLANRFAKMIRTRNATCITHVRITVVGNREQEVEFARTKSEGCCRSMEQEFKFDGVRYRLGFNYGH